MTAFKFKPSDVVDFNEEISVCKFCKAEDKLGFMLADEKVSYHAMCAFLNGCEFKVEYSRDANFDILKGIELKEL